MAISTNWGITINFALSLTVKILGCFRYFEIGLLMYYRGIIWSVTDRDYIAD